MKKNLRFVPLIIVAVAIVVAAVTLVVYEGNLLWKVQELNLFLHTSLFFRQQMVVAGGLLSWAGSYFTQFFYHPWLGVAILMAWWILLVALMAKAFSIQAKWLTLLLIPLALLLIANVFLGYWIYCLKLRGCFFVPVIGTTAAVALVWLFRKLPGKWYLRALMVVLTVVVTYPLMGFYGLLAALLMAVISWRLHDMGSSQRITVTVVALLSIIAVPLLYYRLVYYQTNIDNIYWMALPLFGLEEYYPLYYIPYILLVAFLVVLAATYSRRSWGDGVRRWVVWSLAQVGIIAIVAAAVWQFWYKDYNFHKELAMMHSLEQFDWQGVIEEAAEQEEEPTRAIIMMRNLALWRLGCEGDMMYKYRWGSQKSNAPFLVRMTQVAGRIVYFNYGMLNYCYRWCLEDGVEYGWRAEYLKYMSRCAILNGEYQVARKYLNLLKNTSFHRSWAEEQERYLGNPKAVRESDEYGMVCHMAGTHDQLSSDNSFVEMFLMHQLAAVNSDDPILQEQSLIASLWMKDIPMFWPKFFRYAELHPGKHMPLHYQEAAYLYGHLENKVDISGMPFDQEVVRTYDAFMARAQQLSGSMTEEMMRDNMRSQFGHTFFFEYFLNRNQKIY